jgi:glycosyltransferase involved in cell wall biosynthesis
MLNNKRIAVLLCAYNEGSLIGKVLVNMPKFVDTIIVVDDGSTDKTAEIARGYGATVISHLVNKGLGVAMYTGINMALESSIDILVSIDADNQFDSSEIPKLINPIITGQADLVIGSRFKNRHCVPAMSKIKYCGNKLMSFIVTHITGQKFYDVSCGFRSYSWDAMLRLNLHGKFTYTHESLLVMSFQNVVIQEIPVTVRGAREIGKAKISSNLVIYGARALKIILQTYRDYEPFALFSFIGLIFLIISASCGLSLFLYYFRTGSFFPYKWIGFVSGGSLIICILFIILGFILDSLSVMRRNQEQILYLLKKLSFRINE